MTLSNLGMTLTGLDAELADCSSEDLEGMIRFLADLEYQVRPERADFDWHSPSTPRRLSLMLYRAHHTLETELERREEEGGSSTGLGSVEEHRPPALPTMWPVLPGSKPALRTTGHQPSVPSGRPSQSSESRMSKRSTTSKTTETNRESGASWLGTRRKVCWVQRFHTHLLALFYCVRVTGVFFLEIGGFPLYA